MSRNPVLGIRGGVGTVSPAAAFTRVAVLVETSLAPGREILQGISRYARGQGHWQLQLHPHALDEELPAWLSTWSGQGLIACLRTRRLAEAARALGVPVVDVLGAARVPGLPLVQADPERIAALAAEHLLERGFRHFGFVGRADELWSQQRRDAFRRCVGPRARTCRVYEVPAGSLQPGGGALADLSAWVAALPKPCGLMVCSDEYGLAVLDACRPARVDVPDDVAVIGVNDDEPLCEAAAPGLSSVWPDHTRVGYTAAELLDRLMRGREPASPAPITVPPQGILARPSTDVLAIPDREIAAALRLIRQHACDVDGGPTIEHLAAEVSLSRSALQARFRQATGRTIHDEIIRVRLARARAMLAQTDRPIATIAREVGFRHQQYMGAVFRQKLGTTPAQYRRAHQLLEPVSRTA